jgi:hypothetical protein
MKKFRLPELLLGCFLTVAVFSMGMLFSSPPNTSGQTAAERAETPDDRVARYTLWLAALTGCLVVVSAWQGVFLLRAEKTSQALAKLAREEFIATHRPRIIVRFLQGPFHDDDGREFCWVTFANIGETAATLIEIGGDLARRNRDTGDWKIPGLDASPKPIEAVVLDSGQRHVVTITAKVPMSDMDIFGDVTETYELCAVGRVRYQDGNGRIRETAFLRINRDGKEGFKPTSNKEDEYED